MAKYKCPICNAETANLRSHVYKKHNLKASEFKEKYGDFDDFLLPDPMQELIQELKNLKQQLLTTIQELKNLKEEIDNLKAKALELEEKVNSQPQSATQTQAPALKLPTIDEKAAEALKEQLEKTEEQCKKMAKFIFSSIRNLEDAGAKIEYKHIIGENDEKYIVFDVRVAARGIDSGVNKWKVFFFDSGANLYVAEFDAQWTETFESVSVQNSILEKQTPTSWRPEHLRGLRRLVRKIQKTAKEIGLNLVL